MKWLEVDSKQAIYLFFFLIPSVPHSIVKAGGVSGYV